MSLSNFSIVVATDASGGIAKEGTIPWNNRSDMKFFRDTTMGIGTNAVILGRITYESIPPEYRPLKGRHCIVISRTWKQEEHPEITVAESLLDALTIASSNMKTYKDVFVAGGEQIYSEAVKDYIYLCKRIYVTKFKTDYECDQFFPWETVKDYPYSREPLKTRDYVRYFIEPRVRHQEIKYLNLLQKITEGESKTDRTGVGTQSIFGSQIEFDITEELPILTTKKVNYENIIKELLFFISGKTDTKILEDQGVNIWKGNTSKSFLEQRDLDYEEGDMGPGYGFQWRHWGADYIDATADYTEKGIDQLTRLIEGIKKEPHSRRHVLSTWSVSDIPKMALPPCHILAQFNVSGDRSYLDCQFYMRSTDTFLGLPYNLTSYALLTYMIAHVTNLKPRKLVYVGGDTHIYSNHGLQVKKQLARTPRPFPTLRFRKASKIKNIDDFEFDSFIIEGYSSWSMISAKMAV